MTVINLLRDRAARDVPRYLEEFERNASAMVEFVFFSESVARAIAWELRRQIRRRGRHYSVTRHGTCVFLTNRDLWDDVEGELALLLDGLLKRDFAGGQSGQPPAEASS